MLELTSEAKLDPEVRFTQEVTCLIDWVNSLDISSCAFVDTLEDLRSGCVVSDIVAWLLDKPALAYIEHHATTMEDALHNWNIILEELSPFLDEEFKDLTAAAVVNVLSTQDKFCLVAVLSFLAALEDPEIVQQVQKPAKPAPSSVLIERPSPPSTSNIPQERPPSSEKSKPPLEPELPPEYFPEELPRAADVEFPMAPPQQAAFEPPPVDETLKEKLILWIEELQIVRKGGLDCQLLPAVCRTGVLLCDIINRLEGRAAPIKGIERNPKNRTQALANINKVLDHLRKYPKMDAKYLWASKELLEGNENVIWGLLESIQKFYSIKSGKPPVRTKPTPRSVLQQPSVTESYYEPPPQPVRPVKPPMEERAFTPELRSKPRAKELPARGYAKSSRCRTPLDSSQSVYTRRSRMEEGLVELTVSEETKDVVREWLWALDIELLPGTQVYDDPVLNGELVCELVKICEGVRVKVTPNPRTQKAVRSNFEKAIAVLKKKKAGVPERFLQSVDALLMNPDCVWAFLHSLMLAYPFAVSLFYQPCALQYGALQIKQVEQTVIDWLISLQIVHPEMRPRFADVIPEMKSGMLLCELAIRVFNTRPPKVIFNPTTEQTALNNIRKALEVMRKSTPLSQKFTWSEKEIVKGNPSVILGLLEDISKFTQARAANNSFSKASGGPDVSRQTNESFRSLDQSSVMPSPESILEWLDSLGIPIPDTLDFQEEYWPEFSTGVFLCDIVSQTERIKIPGIDREPRSRNAALKNIRKVLEVLRHKPTFPIKLTQTEEEILDGEKEVILKILKALMKLKKAREL